MTERSKKSSHEIEEGSEFLLDFDKLDKVAHCGQPLVPVAVQDVGTKEVLVIAYANRAALDHTLEQKVATFWSTSRNELWVKGATSGDYLDLVDVRVNCEQNSLLYLVKPRGEGACHTKGSEGAARSGCFYRRLSGERLEFAQ
jgi:phosphoribosyl-AMP cyclohydrolase